MAPLVLMAAALLAQQKNDFPPTPGWHPDLATGLAEAKKTGKPMMIVFR